MNGGTAVGYKLYRNNGTGTSVSSAPDSTCGMETNPAPQHCTITGLVGGETYQIAVASVNEIGEAPLSDVETMFAATLPETPPVPTITAATKTPTLTLSWAAPGDNGNQIYDYFVTVLLSGSETSFSLGGTTASPVGTPSSPGAAVTTTINAAVFSSLQASEQYQLKIAARNQLGLGAYSEYTNTTDGTGYTLSAPNAVTSFARHSDTPINTAVKLAWNAVSGTGNTGGASDEDNKIEFDVYGDMIDGLQGVKLQTTAYNVLSFDHTGLT